MKWQLSPRLIDKLKKVDVRVRKSFYESIRLFEQSSYDLHLDNHALEGEFAGFRSIDVTNDYRAIYEEVPSGSPEPIAYFFLLGTHKEPYG
jgi:mRNA-degrading endonuclease YafQ of YafQ-DinJ toxin-antitoxin module